MDNINSNITKWNDIFQKYIEILKKSEENINNITEIKNNLNNLIGKQINDDVIFYKSIIENSCFYLNNSLKVRQIKFFKDLNYLWKQVNEYSNNNTKNINFNDLLTDYKKKAESIINAVNNNTNLRWVKNDKIDSLIQFENEMNQILNYHLQLFEFFLEYSNLEMKFYSKK